MDLVEYFRNGEEPARHDLAAYGAAPLRGAAAQSGARARAEQVMLSRKARDRFSAEVMGVAAPDPVRAPAEATMLILAAGTPGAPAPDDGTDWLDITLSDDGALDAAADAILDRAAARHRAGLPIVLRAGFPRAEAPELRVARVVDALVERGVPRRRLQVLPASRARETVF